MANRLKHTIASQANNGELIWEMRQFRSQNTSSVSISGGLYLDLARAIVSRVVVQLEMLALILVPMASRNGEIST